MMGFGWGFLKQMNDTLKHNRDLLGSKKSAKEIYRDEIRQRGSTYESVDINALRVRVEKALKRNRIREIFAQIIAIVSAVTFVSFIIWWAATKDWSIKEDRYADKTSLFSTVVYKKEKNNALKVDYYKRGTKAAETNLLNGLRHQNSESYYETGEQFRAALYFRDTLVMETYFYKSGDTIKNFPIVSGLNVHRIHILNERGTGKIEFDFYDGKIIRGTYLEAELTR